MTLQHAAAWWCHVRFIFQYLDAIQSHHDCIQPHSAWRCHLVTVITYFWYHNLHLPMSYQSILLTVTTASHSVLQLTRQWQHSDYHSLQRYHLHLCVIPWWQYLYHCTCQLWAVPTREVCHILSRSSPAVWPGLCTMTGRCLLQLSQTRAHDGTSYHGLK